MSLCDPFDRAITYLRISVTDRCNLRCTYCMPAGGVPLRRHEEILSFEEIAAFTQVAVGLGIRKVRITGGEPLVRRGVVGLVERLAAIGELEELTMTTNGILLGGLAEDLKRAGLGRVNVSLDAMDPRRYREITRGGEVEQALAGIDAAITAGLTPVKINTVIIRDREEPDAIAVAAFARSRGLEIRFIRQMDLCGGAFWVVDGGDGGNCGLCNKLRLTSTGGLKPCLFSDDEYDIRALGYEGAIRAAVAGKPPRGTVNTTGNFNNIGG